jgi:hypothetical protein
LPTKVDRPIQLVPSKHVQLVLPTHVYIFLETFSAHDQHESLTQIILFFEQAFIVAQRWFHIVNILANFRAKFNVVENLLEESNNQLQAYCLELISNKQTLLNKNKELTPTKAHILKL